MDWTQVDIYTTTAAIDLLSVKLQDLGIRGCVVQDAQDFQEFLEQKDGKWDYLEDGLMELANCETCITVYLPVDSQGAETMAALRAMLARMKEEDTEHLYGRLEISCSGIREEDWANNWKQYFKPFPVGKKLFIKPSWEPVTEAAEQNRSGNRSGKQLRHRTASHHPSLSGTDGIRGTAKHPSAGSGLRAAAFSSSAVCCWEQSPPMPSTSRKTPHALHRKMRRKTASTLAPTPFPAAMSSQTMHWWRKSARDTISSLQTSSLMSSRQWRPCSLGFSRTTAF